MSDRSTTRPNAPPNNESKDLKMHTTEITFRVILADSQVPHPEVIAEAFAEELILEATEHLLDGESIDLVNVSPVPVTSRQVAA